MKAFYNAYLGRNPEQTGWDYWTNLYELGMDKSSLTYAMIKTAPSKEFETRCAAAGFVTEDLNGLREFPHSMSVGEVQLFSRLYNGLLRRAISTAELEGRCKQFRSGVPYHDICYGVMKSEECIWKETTEEDFVRRAYRAILGREPRTDELTYYLAQLASVHRLNNNPNFATYSKMSRKEVLYELMRTPEFTAFYNGTVNAGGSRPLAVPVITGDTIIDIDQEYISRMVKKRVFDKYPKLTQWNTDVDWLSRRDVSHDWCSIGSHVPKNCTFLSPFTDEDHIDGIAWLILDRMEGTGREPGTYDGFAGFAFERDATQNPITGEISYGFYFQ